MQDGTMTQDTTEPVTSLEADKSAPSQATQPDAKAEPQDTGAPKVEGAEDQKPTREEAGRPKPSDYYQVRELKKTITEMQKQIRDMAAKTQNPLASLPSPTQSPDRYQIRPGESFEDYQRRVTRDVRDEIMSEILERRLPDVLNQHRTYEERDRNAQEAMELLFPKSGADDRRPLAERVISDPERAEEIQRMLIETKLNILSETHPKEAAIALKTMMDASKPQTPKNPNAIKKSLVGSTATGSPVQSGGKVMPTLAEIKTQLNALDAQLDRNPDLRYEDTFKAKRQELKNQLSTLAKELGK